MLPYLLTLNLPLSMNHSSLISHLPFFIPK
jgi:hypothetical protein